MTPAANEPRHDARMAASSDNSLNSRWLAVLKANIQVWMLRPGLKTLLVRGFSETGRVRSAQLLGAGAYVKKPFGIEAIGMAVRKELDRDRSAT